MTLHIEYRCNLCPKVVVVPPRQDEMVGLVVRRLPGGDSHKMVAVACDESGTHLCSACLKHLTEMLPLGGSK